MGKYRRQIIQVKDRCFDVWSTSHLRELSWQLKGLATFCTTQNTKVQQIYFKLTRSTDNDGRELHLLRCWSFCKSSKNNFMKIIFSMYNWSMWLLWKSCFVIHSCFFFQKMWLLIKLKKSTSKLFDISRHTQCIGIHVMAENLIHKKAPKPFKVCLTKKRVPSWHLPVTVNYSKPTSVLTMYRH